MLDVLAMFQNNITAATPGMYLPVSCGIDVTSLLFLCLINSPCTV